MYYPFGFTISSDKYVDWKTALRPFPFHKAKYVQIAPAACSRYKFFVQSNRADDIVALAN